MSKFIGMSQKSGDYKLEDANTKEIREGSYHNFYMHYVDEAEISGASSVGLSLSVRSINRFSALTYNRLTPISF